MTKILFICRGNIGRSQMGEAFYNYFTKTNDAFSAGTSSSTPKSFSKIPKEIVEIMEEEDIDITNHKVKTVTKKMVSEADKVFVMCKKGYCPDFLLNSEKVTFWEIEDPYKKNIEDMKKIRNKIKDRVLSII